MPRAGLLLRRHQGRRQPRPVRPHRRDLRPARPQRRRQDDRDPLHHHAPAGPHGPGEGVRARRREGADGGTAPARLRTAAAVRRCRDDGPRERDAVRPRLRRPAPRTRRPGRPGTGRRRSHRRRRPDGQDLLRRHDPPTGTRPGAGQRAPAADARRADDRSRPDRPQQRLGAHQRRTAGHGHDRAGDDALHGRGRAVLRPGRPDAPGPDPRARHLRRTAYATARPPPYGGA